jgi:hypothetical protein
MPNVDFTWVKEQLTESKTKIGVGDAVLELLEAWKTMEVGEEFQEDALDLFKTLALGHSLHAPYADEVWVEAAPGQLKVADKVRVKHNAFSNEVGRTHNGRIGTVVAIRYGDIIVRTTDGKEPHLDGAHYSPFHLEKRVK